MIENLNADKALSLLLEGNSKYLNANINDSNISLSLRSNLFSIGQKPFAVIITCSDSRVIPEHIFMQGLGSLFVIRNAGNVVDNDVLGSVEYAVMHLGCKLVVVLGHTNCGAIKGCCDKSNSLYINAITNKIIKNVGNNSLTNNASKINAVASADEIKTKLKNLPSDVSVISALYYTDSGKVEVN